jgi:hypothetical protein
MRLNHAEIDDDLIVCLLRQMQRLFITCGDEHAIARADVVKTIDTILEQYKVPLYHCSCPTCAAESDDE